MAKTITLTLDDTPKTTITVTQDDFNKDAPVQLNIQRNYNSVANVNLTKDDAAMLLMALKNIAESIK